MLDQALTNPATRFVVFGIAGILLVAAGWGAAIIWTVESRYRAQRKADRIKRKADEIAAASNVPHHLCGMDKR